VYSYHSPGILQQGGTPHLTYTPKNGLNNINFGLDSITIHLVDSLGDSPLVDSTIHFNIIPVDVPPIVTDTSGQTYTAIYNGPPNNVPVVINSLVVTDYYTQEFNDPLLVIISGTFTDSITILGNTSSFGIVQQSATQLKFTGTVQVVNQVLGQGIQWDPNGNSITGTLVLSVSDQGAGGGAPLVTNYTTSINVIVQQDTIAGGFIGLTTLMSAGVLGIYKVLKNKKVIPEEADPWENDELFNATLDNPLFAGSPTTMEPMFE